MTQLLIRYCIKDAHNTRDLHVRNRYGYMASMSGIVVNLLVCLGELIVGFLVGSIAMISDGIHNVADAGGSLVSLASFKLSGKKADVEHPYGHGRMEYILSIAFSALLFFVAFQLLKESIDHIMNPEVVEFSIASFIVMICAMGLKIWLSSFLKTIGQTIDSPILIANGMESLADVWATAGITIGLIVGGIFHFPIDGYLGFIVACMIGRAGYHVLKEAISRLLGSEPSPERIEEIQTFVGSFPGVIGIHDLMIHDYGPGHEYASIHVEVDAKTDFIEAHNLVDHIERQAAIKLQLKLTIHMDPIVHDARMISLYNRLSTVITAYNPTYTIHDLRLNDEQELSFELKLPLGNTNDDSTIQTSITNLVSAVFPGYTIQCHVSHNYVSK